jgi:hypothetical protein
VLVWSAAARPLNGTAEGGDLHVVVEVDGGALAAVIDGAGHGAEAAEAAAQAAEVLRAFPTESPLRLVRRCHERLRLTRGAVMSLASFDAQRSVVTWLGVGDVSGTLVRGRGVGSTTFLLPRAGVVGVRLPTLFAQTLPIARGDTVVFATDGVSTALVYEIDPTASTQIIAERILARHGRSVDDALVLVTRCVGGRI